jgi:hypothetical protein
MRKCAQLVPKVSTWQPVRFVLLAACLSPSGALAQGLYQQYLDGWRSTRDPLEQWVFANGQKVAELMPQPVSGVVDHLPWESVDNYLPHFESYVHHRYFGFSVKRMWAFDDPQLFGQVAQARQRFDEAKEKINSPESIQNIQTQRKAVEAANARYLKEFQDLWSQGKQKEAQEVLRKRDKDPIFQLPPEFAENQRREEELRELEGRGRKLSIEIQASYPPLNWPVLKQIGTIKGYPLFRAVSGDVILAVYVGPKGFRNPPAGKDPQEMKMKCFLGLAQVPGEKNYEALARQMLEEINYDALARMMEP